MEAHQVTIKIPKKPQISSAPVSPNWTSVENNETLVEVPVEGILLDILSQIYDERKSA